MAVPTQVPASGDGMKALEGYRKLGIAGMTIWLAAEGKQWWLVAVAFVGYTIANLLDSREADAEE